MSISYTINKEHDGIEIKFSEKPSKDVLAKMKTLGFRWHQLKCVCFANRTEERLKFADSIKEDFEQMTIKGAEPKKAEPKKAEPKKKEKVTSILKKQKKEEPKEEPKEEYTQFTFDFSALLSVNIDDCRKKMAEEKKLFSNPEHGYVIDGILKMAEASEDFARNLMKAEKTYTKAFQYVTEQAKKKAKNGCACLSADEVLEICLDYYNA